MTLKIRYFQLFKKGSVSKILTDFFDNIIEVIEHFRALILLIT